MERWIEPEPPLRRKIRRHVDVGDEEAVAKRLSLEVETQHWRTGLRAPSQTSSQSHVRA
jgi:hypothetical protein